MTRAFWGWVCWFVFLFIIDFTVPFRTLHNIPTMAGSFLFWLIWMAVAIISMFVIFLRWQDEPQ